MDAGLGQLFDLLAAKKILDEAVVVVVSDHGEHLGDAPGSNPWQGVETDPRWGNVLKPRSARRGRHKYFQSIYQATEELYDLAADPTERTNLLISPRPEDSAVASDLRAALAAWTASARPLPSHFESSQERETIERLKSLGYL